MTQPRPLDYQAQRNSGRWTRRVVFTVAVIIVAIIAFKAEDWWDSLKHQYWSSRARSYAPPAGTIIYEDDSEAAARLLAESPDYKVLQVERAASVASDRQTPVAHYPPIGKHYLGELPFAFLHERNTTEGSYLAFVTVWLDAWSHDLRVLHIRANSVDIATDSIVGREGFFITLSGSDTLRIYAGQPDAKSKSAFQIKYKFNDAEGEIDGQIKGSGDIALSVLGPLSKGVSRDRPRIEQETPSDRR